MSAALQTKTTLVCCSVLRAELLSLSKTHWTDATIRFQDSMLHMEPERLALRLATAVEGPMNRGQRVVLIYGDCCARMAALEANPGVVRTRGRNCCELLLGRDEYRRLSHAGAFFLLPEWTSRWQEVFVTEFGLSRENATSLMRDMHHQLVYLDTGVVPVPESALHACAEYCGLPCVVQPASLEPLQTAVRDALLRFDTAGEPL